jgi:hypothetical protein
VSPFLKLKKKTIPNNLDFKKDEKNI